MSASETAGEKGGGVKPDPQDAARPPEESAKASSNAASPRRAPYAPPRLERLGNLRDVVGKSGGARDAAPPHPRRP